jgi:hypothetical protein
LECPNAIAQASRGHRPWAKEIRPNQTLFGVSGEVRSKDNLTEPALLEMSGNHVDQEPASSLSLRLLQKMSAAAISNGEAFLPC